MLLTLQIVIDVAKFGPTAVDKFVSALPAPSFSDSESYAALPLSSSHSHSSVPPSLKAVFSVLVADTAIERRVSTCCEIIGLAASRLIFASSSRTWSGPIADIVSVQRQGFNFAINLSDGSHLVLTADASNLNAVTDLLQRLDRTAAAVRASILPSSPQPSAASSDEGKALESKCAAAKESFAYSNGSICLTTDEVCFDRSSSPPSSNCLPIEAVTRVVSGGGGILSIGSDASMLVHLNVSIVDGAKLSVFLGVPSHVPELI